MKQVIHIINATGQKVAEGELDTETGVITAVKLASQGADDVVRCQDSDASETIHARAGYQVKASADDRAWKQGEETKFVFMPAGVHTITAGFRKGSINLTVKVDKASAEAAQASLESLRAARPKQKPYGCVEHREQEASVIAHHFESDEQENVLLAAEPTALGAQNVNGRIHWSWSPSFTTDAEYNKCKCGDCGLNATAQVRGDKVCACAKPSLYFPRDARGSASNPARVTGVDFVLGTLTNRPAFHEMPPVRASEDGTVTATWSDAARKAALEARRLHGWAHKGSYEGGKVNVYHKVHDTRFGPVHRVVVDDGEPTTGDPKGYSTEKEAMSHAEKYISEAGYKKDTTKASGPTTDSATIQATGTSEGARKGWEHRSSMAHAATGVAKVASSYAEESGSSGAYKMAAAAFRHASAEHKSASDAIDEHMNAHGYDKELANEGTEHRRIHHAHRDYADKLEGKSSRTGLTYTDQNNRIVKTSDASDILASLRPAATGAAAVLQRLRGETVRATGTSEGARKGWTHRIHFHSASAKSAFIKDAKLAPNEFSHHGEGGIESDASTAALAKNSPHHYQTTEIKANEAIAANSATILARVSQQAARLEQTNK